MIENLPAYISVIFGCITVVTLLLFYRVIKKSDSAATSNKANAVLIGCIIWVILQSMLTLKNVYNSNLAALPPKLMLLGILPALIAIVFLFVTSKGRQFIDSLPLKNLTYISTVRVIVEFILFRLFIYKAIPESMTFEGRNFDIFSGITAPFVAYFGFTKKRLSRQIILVWNFICLGLLMNVVTIAMLSAPFPFQRLAFDQPNIAILNFPFSWLPTFLVPVVLFGHLVSIRQLLRTMGNNI
ncbi:MAG: hypothetical protein PW786_02425 [Arachidicoccus sp.]|nr:hypothetical protein [Arachidicoccus sp.]